ncbi:MAG: SDR family NAD(P)-dependent oxidoreductase [Deltaproteobacteria bacterium]|nr:SDR family NAD(P)-dependent oxidoreductase [Deltaproteobacteria bacterium]
MSRFDGQVVAVTGAASGIGLAIAKRLTKEGAHVVAWDRDRRALEVAFGTSSSAVAAARAVDIADDGSVAAATEEIVTRFEKLDGVIHCAGVVGPNGKTIVDVSTEEFENVCRVNLVGSFVVTRHALKAMLPRQYGRILLFASIAGKEGNAGMCAYSASKAGVIALAKSAGKEMATKGITVNAIAPGVINTPLVQAMEPAQVAYMTEKIPMQRTGSLDEVASLACWIISREASFTTGFTFDLSGGRATY